MRLRITKIDEYQFLTCLYNGLWGSQNDRFKDWRKGDYIAVIVDKNMAALSEVSGEPFYSKEKVWDNGLFPYRIPIKFKHVIDVEDRPPILGVIRDTMTKAWGPRYGWGILNQQVLESPHADTIVKAITDSPNSQQKFNDHIDELVEEAKLARERSEKVTRKKRKKVKKRAEDVMDFQEEIKFSSKDQSTHTKIQAQLVQLGKITGSSIWIASNDQNKQYKGKKISDGCLKNLPSLGLSDEATKRISLIDIIWISQGAPICAFEIETSTSVYSGLLRLSDLISLVPALKIGLFIIAPKERQEKVLRELSRPTFRKIGLNEYCRFISSEDLQNLLERIRDYEGYVQHTILNKIAIELEDEEVEREF
jgi:hypothetical protein